jgi:ribosomal protein S11
MNITTNSNNKKTSPNLILQGQSITNELSERLHCCYIRMKLKENNVFVNVTNLKGQTIIKYSSGIISTKGNVKQNKKRSRAAIQ